MDPMVAAGNATNAMTGCASGETVDEALPVDGVLRQVDQARSREGRREPPGQVGGFGGAHPEHDDAHVAEDRMADRWV